MKISARFLANALLAGGVLALGMLAPSLSLGADKAASSKAKTPVPTATPKAPSGAWSESVADAPAADNGSTVVVDPKTKERLERIPKSPIYFVRQGRLFNAIIADTEGVPLVKEDEKAYYIKALPDRPDPTEEQKERQRVLDLAPPQAQIVEIGSEEVEVVAPPISGEKLRFEEFSQGLPRTGLWRDSFAIGDLDGDGQPEIVTPPPRLSGQGLRVFKLTPAKGKTPAEWRSVECEYENPEKVEVSYGGTAVADFDGDGRLDIAFGGHGAGVAVAYNKGNWKFRIESRGLPRQSSTRALEAGDLDGDGKPDLVVLSDLPERLTGSKPPEAGGYIPGYDVRAYINDGTRFRELLAGLDNASFGYSLGLWAKDASPFFVSSCRYFGNQNVLLTFNRKTLSFERVALDVIERYALHLGATVGKYKGIPAGFVSYMKNSPPGATRNADAEGVSIYYREGETWKRKRVVKRTGERSGTQGIGVGDLNGDGLDDVVFADEMTHKIRVFFQTPAGEFEELDPAREPTFINHVAQVRIADMDRDGKNDIVLMYNYFTGDDTRSGGLRVLRTVR